MNSKYITAQRGAKRFWFVSVHDRVSRLSWVNGWMGKYIRLVGTKGGTGINVISIERRFPRQTEGGKAISGW